MGKQHKPSSFIPGFRPLAPGVWIMDGALEASISNFNSNGGDVGLKSKYNNNYAASVCTTTSASPAHPSPDTIVIASWTGASPRHIRKYTDTYGALYPAAAIMVLTTSIDDLAFKSTSQKETALAPAVAFLQGRNRAGALHRSPHQTSHTHPHHQPPTTTTPPPCPGTLLLAAFSEGGANKSVCLARAYLRLTGRPLPVGGYVFDSTPGTPRFTNNLAAFRRSLPRNFLSRTLGYLFGLVVLALTWAVFCLFVGFDNNAISKTRRALNDEALWPLDGVPRTYIFSEADDLIWWRDVEDHAEAAARDVGVTSLVVKYKASGHCGHVRDDEAVYWGAVRQTWEARDVELGNGVVGRQTMF